MARKHVSGAVALALCTGMAVFAAENPKAADWAMNATVIEACSCPMFCQCYFNTEPAGHHDHGGAGRHFCRANNAYKVNKGHYGDVKLDGVKFWMSGDLGDNFADGEMDWAVVTFDKAMTREQREAVGAIMPQLFPVKWKSFQTAEGSIDTWEYDNDKAVALLDGGRTAEVRLKRPAAAGNTPAPIVIQNLRYWGAPRNEGFVLMPNEVEAYRVGSRSFEYRGTNGFMVTFDITSKDVAAAPSAHVH